MNPFTRAKILAGYGLAMILVIGVGVLSVRSVNLLHEDARMVSHTHELLATSWRLMSNLDEAISRSRGFILTGREEYLEPIEGIFASIRDAFGRLRAQSNDNLAQQERLRELEPVIQRRVALVREAIEARRTQGLEASAKLVTSSSSYLVTQRIRDGMGAFEAEENRLLAERTARTGESLREARVVVVSGCLLAVALVVLSSLAVRRDFLALMRAEAELDRTIAFQKGILDNAQCSIITVFPDGRISSINRTALAWLGYEAAELVGRQTPAVIHDPAEMEARRKELSAELGRELPAGIEVFTARLEAQASETREWTYVRKDGTRFPVQLSVSAMRSRQGERLGYIGVASDITKRKNAERELRVAAEAATAASKAKSEFLANMSHELRTPLNSVIGFANVLRKNKDGALQAKELTYLERIQDNGRHLLDLINSILDLSKIEAGKMEAHIESFGLDELVAETLGELQGHVQGRAVELRAEPAPGAKPVESDRARLKQVIINLTANALKFTEHGSVTVRTVADAAGNVLRLEVADTGIGIPPEKLHAIFEAFQQADSGTSRKYGGTGLGLTISRAICDLLGYAIRVRSEAGRGSTFSVEMAGPAASPPRRSPGTQPIRTFAGRSSARQPAVAPLKGKRVLLIDDDMDTGVVFKEMLADTGCVLLQARSGEEGLLLARSEAPDLILLDMLLPETDGRAVLSRLRARPETGRIGVLVVSIVAEDGQLDVPPEDRIQKPVSRERLLEAMVRHLAPQG
ncbi:MAG: CHASE3 domain-containing protein [Planctomycetota bacterium]|nr:CHASE3 domain-containing protein [Planctomycetota bacterium]